MDKKSGYCTEQLNERFLLPFPNLSRSRMSDMDLSPGASAIGSDGLVWFNIIHIGALISIFASACGNSIVVLDSLFVNGNKASLVNRLPIYLSLFDSVLAITHSVDHGFLLLFHVYPEKIFCESFGASLFVGYAGGVLSLLLVVLVFWLKIVHQKSISLGKNDRFIFLIIFTMIGAQIILFTSLGLFGQSPHWCLLEQTTLLGRVMFLLVLLFVFSVVGIVAVCYAQMLKAAKKSQHELELQLCTEEPDAPHNALFKWNMKSPDMNDMKTIEPYIWVFFFRQLPICVSYCISFIIGVQPPSLIILIIVISINIGGVFNALIYNKQKKLSSMNGRSGSKRRVWRHTIGP